MALALKEWNIPRQSVTLLAGGPSSNRLIALSKGQIVALAAGVERILIDNQSPETVARWCRIARTSPAPPFIEASGNMTLDRVRAYALAGADAVSVGALTHSSPALDLALDVGLPADACQLATGARYEHPVDGLNSLGLLEFDAVLGKPGQQVRAPGADEAASGEPGVIGDLGDRRRRREE